MNKTKFDRLMAIKEEFAQTQARLMAVRELEEKAQAASMSALLENDLEQAELVLAAQDIMNKLQNMAEDLAKINAQDLFPLADKMKGTFGQEAAHAFEQSAQEVVSGAMNTVRHAKDELGNAIMRLEGKMPANDMAAEPAAEPAMDEPAADMSADAGMDAAMDDFGAADSASGPEDEPLGRARKESVETKAPMLSESVILEAAGQKLIETEGLDSLIDWILNEAAAGMPEEHFRSFAKTIASRAAKDPAKLAGWIGKKRGGMAAMAQLAAPTFTAHVEPELAIVESIEEGKTFKNSDDDDDNWNKKNQFAKRKNARKDKQSGDDVVEGKTFKNNDDDDDNWVKKNKMSARKNARKDKRAGDDNLSEDAQKVAKAVAMVIEANLLATGQGNAAQVVREYAERMANASGLMEGEGDSAELIQAWILESFEAVHGVKPASYSVAKLKEFTAPMNNNDKKIAAGVMGKIAGKMAGDKTLANKPMASAMKDLSNQERNVANKMVSALKKDGKDARKIGDFAAGAATLAGDETNEGLEENINAAHWPIDTHGQYKGEPLQTDYGKLKAPKTPLAGKTETVSGGESEAPKAPKAEEPKSEEPKGNPFAKKEESEDDSEK